MITVEPVALPDTADQRAANVPVDDSDPSDNPVVAEAVEPARRDASMAQINDAANAASGDGGTVAYLPVAQLTERPQVLQDIPSEWTLHDLSPQRISCVLLISEYGDVDRVLFDAPSLTLQQRQALRERFQVARFVPGKLYGRSVRSALRIEVSLD